MKYYRMCRRFLGNGAFLFQASHDLTLLSSGALIEGFKGSLVCKLDPEEKDPDLPTFFEDPAFIGTKAFEQELAKAGVDNIQVLPVVIKDTRKKRQIKDYVLLNIVGRVSCADMSRSEHSSLSDDPNDDMTIIDKLVIHRSKVRGLDLFVADEDTDCIVVSKRVRDALAKAGHEDVLFEELDTVA